IRKELKVLKLPHYGNAVSNRRRFANNFLPLTLGTLLVIMIVKSSIALSLGLVGALSIVRFRAAIKDPEELVYLFMTIGIGLACGANQPLLAVIAFTAILTIIWAGKMIGGEQKKLSGRLFINITTDLEDLEVITKLLVEHLNSVELKRMDTLDQGLDLSFVGRADSPQQLNALQQAVRKLSDSTKLSLLEQPELIV
ncbi:MAG: DUF4956 domain-containing protein, partial [Bacteroidota bacterium]